MYDSKYSQNWMDNKNYSFTTFKIKTQLFQKIFKFIGKQICLTFQASSVLVVPNQKTGKEYAYFGKES